MSFDDCDFMSLTRQCSRKELSELQLPAAVLAIFDGQLPHPSLSYRCRDPHYIFSTPIELAAIRITPMWECGIVVTAYQHTQPQGQGQGQGQGRFIRFSLENHEHIAVLGSSFQSVAAAILIDLWEDDTPDEILREIANLFEFRHLDRLLSECETRLKLGTSIDYEAWHTRFLQSSSIDYEAWHTRFLQSCENAI